MPSHLPVLRSEEDAGPGELEGGPEGDGDEEGVVGSHVAEVGWEGTGRGDVLRVLAKGKGGED